VFTVAEGEWFEVRRFPHRVTMIREPHQREDVKVYLVEGSEDVAVLDTGTGVGDIAQLVASLSGRRPRVLQTHADWDHIGGSHRFTDVLVHAAEADALRRGRTAERYAEAFTDKAVDRRYLPADFDPSHGIPGREPTGLLSHGDMIDLGDRVLEVFHTPGHSPGGLTFLDRQASAMFIGDLLYLGPMLLFFPGGDLSAFRDSLQLAAELAAAVDTVYPAHHETPIQPKDVREIRDAFETVWAGREPDRRGSAYGYPVLIHDFGRFSFLLPRST
jgi:glyoxylase-like metal-dependent hydrolase (beta-lactamase superfamily II)